MKISFLNCRSLHQSDILILTETWLEENQTLRDEYDISGYISNLNILGRGRGITTYFKTPYKHKENANSEGYSITKIESEKMDVIGIYRSQEGNVTSLITKLKSLITAGNTTVVGGDFNICALAYPNNYITKSLEERGFKQIVEKSTHIEGGIIDHVYLIQGDDSKFKYIIEEFPKYYSDHDGLGLILWEEEES